MKRIVEVYKKYHLEMSRLWKEWLVIAAAATKEENEQERKKILDKLKTM
ncbi:MAG: hypothetical protein V1707_01580 [bacterium]